jgi:hypothetical protein
MMMSTTIATPATSSSSSKNTSPFDDAKRANKLTFAAYVVSLLVAAGLTYLAGRSADRVAELAQADANRRIAESSERAGKLEHDNLELRNKIAPLEKDAADAKKALAEVNNVAGIANEAAGKANERAARLELDAEALKSSNLAMESALEKERTIRIQLEKSVAIRRIIRTDKTIPRLAQFKGTRVDVEYEKGDHEAELTGGQIVASLREAGWVVESYSSAQQLGWGVSIWATDTVPGGHMHENAATEFADFLEANDIDTAVMPRVLLSAPGAKFIIRVGTKLPRLSIDDLPPELKEQLPMKDFIAHSEETSAKYRAERRSAARQRWFK